MFNKKTQPNTQARGETARTTQEQQKDILHGMLESMYCYGQKQWQNIFLATKKKPDLKRKSFPIVRSYPYSVAGNWSTKLI